MLALSMLVPLRWVIARHICMLLLGFLGDVLSCSVFVAKLGNLELLRLVETICDFGLVSHTGL